MPRSSIAEGARVDTDDDPILGARQAISKGCDEVVIEAVPGVLATVQWPLSLLSSQTAPSQSGVSSRTDWVVLMPGLAQPNCNETVTATAAIAISRQIGG
jgi:hypothetical protein